MTVKTRSQLATEFTALRSELTIGHNNNVSKSNAYQNLLDSVVVPGEETNDINSSRISTLKIPPSHISISDGYGYLRTSRSSGDKFWSDFSVPAIGVWDARKGVIATGTLIDTVTDQSGCSSNATQTSVNRPEYSVNGWSDEGSCITFNGTSQYLNCDGVVGKLQGSIDRSVLILCRLNSIAAFPSFFGTSGADGLVQYQSYSRYGSIYTTANSNQSTTPVVFTADQDILVGFCHKDGASSSYVYANGFKYVIAGDCFGATPSSVIHSTIGCAQVAGSYTAANFANMKLRWVGVFSGLLSDSDYLEAQRRLLGNHFVTVVCDGNSLTQGGFGGGGYYPTTLQSILGPRASGVFNVLNIGVGGQNTDDMISRFSTYVTPNYSVCQNNILVAWELSNQWIGAYGSGGTTRQAVDKFWQYCDTARAAGWKVIALTATYREAGGYVGLPSKAVGDAGIDAMNALVRAEWKYHTDGLADVQAQSFFSATTSSSFNTSDGTHLTQAADDVVAGIVAREVWKQIDRLV